MITAAHLDIEEFLRCHWQRSPCLIRNAVPGFKDPLEPEELAGLALEPGSEARLIAGSEPDWQLRPGPLTAASFREQGPWTLLVQGVDQVVPGVAQLRALTGFLPNWRFDDIMVSYATDGGGVGPHYDNYDVFLLQGRGRRRWRLGQHCEQGEALLPNSGLRLLAGFDEQADYLLEPGDMLYVPPRVAHWGVAEGECMTYSLGFRAPRLNDMLSRWLDSALEQLDEEQFYRDPELPARASPGEISGQQYQQALALLHRSIENTALDPHWFGELVTETQAGDTVVEELPDECPQNSAWLAPTARVAWSASQGTLSVYANGQTLVPGPDSRSLLETLCAGEQVDIAACDESERALILGLHELGCIDGE